MFVFFHFFSMKDVDFIKKKNLTQHEMYLYASNLFTEDSTRSTDTFILFVAAISPSTALLSY